MDHEAEVDTERNAYEESSGSFSRDSDHDFHGFVAFDESEDSSTGGDDSDVSSDSRRAAELFAHLNDLHEGDDELFLEEKSLPHILGKNR
jgi:hypothetical protein